MILPVPGRPGYHVSSEGDVYSTRTRGCKPRIDGPMKLLVPVRSSGRRRYWRVDAGRGKEDIHTLILLAFEGPCPEGQECRHLDGDPRNNRADNLTWGTPAENQADRAVHGIGNQGVRNPNYRHGRYVRQSQ